MKTKPNDLVDATLVIDPVTGMPTTPVVEYKGLTKLEYLSVLMMQTKLASAAQIHGGTPEGHVKLIAQHSVRDALILMEALNEYAGMVEDSKLPNRTYAVEFPLSEILGLDNKECCTSSVEVKIRDGSVNGEKA